MNGIEGLTDVFDIDSVWILQHYYAYVYYIILVLCTYCPNGPPVEIYISTTKNGSCFIILVKSNIDIANIISGWDSASCEWWTRTH
jgi:hypothetical protein